MSNVTLFTAKEARTIAKEAKKRKAMAEMSKIYESIKRGCENGNYEIDYCEDISEEALSVLTDLGFIYQKIGKQNMDEPFQQIGYKIKWYE